MVEGSVWLTDVESSRCSRRVPHPAMLGSGAKAHLGRSAECWGMGGNHATM